MTSHATLTYKRSFHSTSLCCSLHATHTLRLLTLHHSPGMHQGITHTAQPPRIAPAPPLVDHATSLHSSRTRKTSLGSLSSHSTLHIEGRTVLSHLSPNTKQAFALTAWLHPHAPSTTTSQGNIRESSSDRSPGLSMY